MKTAVYTICKNEINRLNRWLEYGKLHDYMVVLDTGSTDGTWEALQQASRIYQNLIIEQKTFTPWKFNIARNYNLEMITQDVLMNSSASMSGKKSKRPSWNILMSPTLQLLAWISIQKRCSLVNDLTRMGRILE